MMLVRRSSLRGLVVCNPPERKLGISLTRVRRTWGRPVLEYDQNRMHFRLDISLRYRPIIRGVHVSRH